MTPREIIAEAWAITKKEKSLRRWGFTSSFFETLLNIKLIAYQIYFLVAYVRGKEVGFFDDAIWLWHNVSHGAFFTIVGSFLLLVLLELFIPHLCQGAIIGLAAKSYKGQKVEGGIVLALHNFFALFAIHEIFVLSGWATVVTCISLMLRYISGSVKFAGIVGIVMIFCISNILKLFAGFAEEAVVIQRKGIFEGITQSYKLLISHLTKIVFLLLLLYVISIRILINAAMVLLIPAIIAGIAFLLAQVFSVFVSYLVAGIIGIGLVIGASFFFAYLHVFKQTVWTLAYIQLVKHKELDVIEDVE